jgi:F-type H+-transporting ATPase subunit delta
MSIREDARLSTLDGLLDELHLTKVGLVGRLLRRDPKPETNLSADLFAVVDALEGSPSLRRAVSDPGTPEEARKNLVHGLLDGKVSDAAATLVAEGAAMRWAGGRTFAAALERQAVRAELLQADADGQLDETEDELFRFARLVQSSPELRDALGDRSVDLTHRQTLVEQLLTGKVSDSTVVLARRAVAARERTFAHSIESYVTLAAQHNNRVVATVRVAKPLSDEQLERLRRALAAQVGREVTVQVIIDEQVLGGVRVELGNEVVEGTVAGRLADARRLFAP